MKLENIKIGQTYLLKKRKKMEKVLPKHFSDTDVEIILLNTYESIQTSEKERVVEVLDIDDSGLINIKIRLKHGQIDDYTWINPICLKKETVYV